MLTGTVEKSSLSDTFGKDLVLLFFQHFQLFSKSFYERFSSGDHIKLYQTFKSDLACIL